MYPTISDTVGKVIPELGVQVVRTPAHGSVAVGTTTTALNVGAMEVAGSIQTELSYC